MKYKPTFEILNHLILRKLLNLASWAEWNWNFGIHQLEVAHFQKRCFPVPIYPLFIGLWKYPNRKKIIEFSTRISSLEPFGKFEAQHTVFWSDSSNEPHFLLIFVRSNLLKLWIKKETFKFWTFQEQALDLHVNGSLENTDRWIGNLKIFNRHNITILDLCNIANSLH